MNEGRVKSVRTRVVAAIAVLACAPAALASQAGDRGIHFEDVSRTIDISGLDVSSQAGAQRLYRQITTAAHRICFSSVNAYRGVLRVQQTQLARHCFDDAVEGALADVTAKTGVDLAQVAGSKHVERAGLAARR